MSRPQEFDREEVLQRAVEVFWSNGYAGSSMTMLQQAMNIGRQSLYATFGDKRGLFLAALAKYLDKRVTDDIRYLQTATPSIQGIKDLVLTRIGEDEHSRAKGCMAVQALAEFGSSDDQVTACLAQGQARFHHGLVIYLNTAKSQGTFWGAADCGAVAGYIELLMNGIVLAARAGTSPTVLRGTMNFLQTGIERAY